MQLWGGLQARGYYLEPSVKRPQRDFPGGAVVKNLHFHCKGHRLDPWSGSYDPTCSMVWAKKRWGVGPQQTQQEPSEAWLCLSRLQQAAQYKLS